MQIWKVIDIIQESTAFLKTRGIENPRLNAEQLLADLLGLSRIELYIQFDRPLTTDERNACKVLLKRRANHEPLQYITGSTEFMSLPFKVTPDVLIPRPETEVLVEKVIEAAGEHAWHILDIGTGSGCIAISLAHYCSNCQITAWESDKNTMKIAIENGKFNQTDDRIHWQVVNILDLKQFEDVNKFDLIVSNPPYVTENEWKHLDPQIRDHEPKIALSDGGNGLLFYHEISHKAKHLLKPEGWLFFEIGDKQAKAVHQIMFSEGFKNLETHQDLIKQTEL